MLCELTSDVDVFLEAAGEYLTSRPVEHNLVLSLAEANRTEPRPSRWAWVTDRRRVVGALCQTPSDHLASVTPMPAAAVEAMVERLSQEDVAVPGVNGEARTVARFAGGWATARSVPRTRRPASGSTSWDVYGCPSGVAGSLRRATADDVERIVEWDGAMAAEVELRASGERGPPEPHLGARRRRALLALGRRRRAACRWPTPRRSWRAPCASARSTRRPNAGPRASPAPRRQRSAPSSSPRV